MAAVSENVCPSRAEERWTLIRPQPYGVTARVIVNLPSGIAPKA